jgi:hypothetical protein
MVNEDLVAGIRNSIERGESIEKAVQSFILAGYPQREVEEAANAIHAGSALVTESTENFAKTQMQPLPQPVQPMPPISRDQQMQISQTLQTSAIPSQQAQLPQAGLTAAQEQPQQKIQQEEIPKEKPTRNFSGGFKRNFKIILLIIILLLLIGVLIATLVFKEQIVAMLS